MTENLDFEHFKARLEARREELKSLHEMSAQARGAAKRRQTSKTLH